MGYPGLRQVRAPFSSSLPSLTGAVVLAPWLQCFHVLGTNSPGMWRREKTGGHALLPVHLHVVTILW